jgi:hypothetical protein
MSEQLNNYTDNNFNLYQAYSYTLLLQVEAQSFSYAVVQQNRLLVSAQNIALHELAEPKQLHDILTATYRNIIIGLPSTGLTLVPNSLFHEDLVSNFARFLDVKLTEKVFAQSLDDQNTIIYKTDNNVVSAVEKFNLQSTVYCAKGWIKAIAKNNPKNDELFIEVGNDTVQFLYFSAAKLRFYNVFEFKNEDELVYFTTFVADELNLKPLTTTLVLSGDIATGDKNYARLSEFYPNIKLSDLQVLEIPGQIPSHKILALAALSLCESSVGV